MMSSMYAQYDFLISLCRVCLISLYLSKTFGHSVFLNFVWSLRLERMSLRMLRVTQGRQCLDLVIFWGMNSRIPSSSVILNVFQSSLTGGCLAFSCIFSKRAFSFRLIPSQSAFRNTNTLRWGVHIRLGRTLISAYIISWSDLPSGGMMTKFCRVDLLLVKSRSRMLPPLVGLSIVCSMLWSSDMSIRRCCSCRLPPAMGETSIDDQSILGALKSPPSQMLPLVLCVNRSRDRFRLSREVVSELGGL